MGLEAEGYAIHTATDGNKAILSAKDINPHIVLLDIMIPGIMEISQYLIMKQYFYRSKEQLLESRYHIVGATVKKIRSAEAVKELAQYLIDNTVVADNGTGIPKKDLGEIFDRFFRSEPHRSRKQGGYGLGLSIVKGIVDAHNGKISVDSELGKGTTFTIHFKLADDQSIYNAKKD
ncbi:MAG: hypothetical protein FIA99_15480 [Ruminiclostridium sp.]|nr:hypothetical protein [Ruminiclostridium sp.]